MDTRKNAINIRFEMGYDIVSALDLRAYATQAMLDEINNDKAIYDLPAISLKKLEDCVRPGNGCGTKDFLLDLIIESMSLEA